MANYALPRGFEWHLMVKDDYESLEDNLYRE
jgi:hypothetical protein